jgi:hypothetical protein
MLHRLVQGIVIHLLDLHGVVLNLTCYIWIHSPSFFNSNEVLAVLKISSLFKLFIPTCNWTLFVKTIGSLWNLKACLLLLL